MVVVADGPVNQASPAKTARTVLCAATVLFSTATPFEFVSAVPAFVPLTKKPTARPATRAALPAAASVACNVVDVRATVMVVPSFVTVNGAEAETPAAVALSVYVPGCWLSANRAVAAPPGPTGAVTFWVPSENFTGVPTAIREVCATNVAVVVYAPDPGWLPASPIVGG